MPNLTSIYDMIVGFWNKYLATHKRSDDIQHFNKMIVGCGLDKQVYEIDAFLISLLDNSISNE